MMELENCSFPRHDNTELLPSSMIVEGEEFFAGDVKKHQTWEDNVFIFFEWFEINN